MKKEEFPTDTNVSANEGLAIDPVSVPIKEQMTSETVNVSANEELATVTNIASANEELENILDSISTNSQSDYDNLSDGVNNDYSKKVSPSYTFQISQLSIEEIDKIKIHPYLELYPRTEPKAYKFLEGLILRYGMNEPIVISDDYLLLAGRDRFDIYNSNRDKVELLVRKVNNKINQIDFIISDKVQRKPLEKSIRGVLAYRTYCYVLKERRKNHKFHLYGKTIEEGKSRGFVAEVFNVSEGYIEFAKLVSTDSALLSDVMEGKIALSKAYNLLKNNSDSIQVNAIKSVTANNTSTNVTLQNKKSKEQSEYTFENYTNLYGTPSNLKQNFNKFADSLGSKSLMKSFTQIIFDEQIKKETKVESDDEKFSKLLDTFLYEKNAVEGSAIFIKVEELRSVIENDHITKYDDRLSKFQSEFENDLGVIDKCIKINLTKNNQSNFDEQLKKLILDSKDCLDDTNGADYE
jgi:hypothetical protein